MGRDTTKGFTLIEIMLVVIILAILAMLTIPQLSDASDESGDKALLGDLGTAQRQIGRYKCDHGNCGQHMKPDGTVDNSGANFIARMTGRTDPSGVVNPSGDCGPYFRDWPANPFIANGAVAKQVKIGSTPAPRDETTGWWFDVVTQTIQPNSTRGALNEFPAP